MNAVFIDVRTILILAISVLTSAASAARFEHSLEEASFVMVDDTRVPVDLTFDFYVDDTLHHLSDATGPRFVDLRISLTGATDEGAEVPISIQGSADFSWQQAFGRRASIGTDLVLPLIIDLDGVVEDRLYSNNMLLRTEPRNDGFRVETDLSLSGRVPLSFGFGDRDFTASRLVPDGDFNGNGSVDFADFLALRDRFGSEGNYFYGDFNRDGFVGFSDFTAFASNYGVNSTTHAADTWCGVPPVPLPDGRFRIEYSTIVDLIIQKDDDSGEPSGVRYEVPSNTSIEFSIEGNTITYDQTELSVENAEVQISDTESIELSFDAYSSEPRSEELVSAGSWCDIGIGTPYVIEALIDVGEVSGLHHGTDGATAFNGTLETFLFSQPSNNGALITASIHDDRGEIGVIWEHQLRIFEHLQFGRFAMNTGLEISPNLELTSIYHVRSPFTPDSVSTTRLDSVSGVPEPNSNAMAVMSALSFLLFSRYRQVRGHENPKV